MPFFFPLVLVFLALATVWLLDKWRPLQLHATARISSIDGLRGYLALGVFMHHSSLWFFYLKYGKWEFPAPSIDTHFGEISVALFFMITGFLFTSKLRKAAPEGIDWLRLYTARVLRIAPLWLVVKVLVVMTAWLIRRLTLDSGNPAHLPSTASTGLMTAGVTWTLYYEWLFYCALPWLALLLRKKPTVAWLVCNAVVIALIGWDRLASIHSWMFVGGMLTAWLAPLQPLRRFACSAWGSLCALALVVGVATGFDSANACLPTLLLTAAFVLIAAGASLFGLLNVRLSRVLGEITFSIYLLHGFVLFIAFRFALGLHHASALDSATHWILIAGLTPVLITLSYLSFRYIEAPAMHTTNAATARLQALSTRVLRGGKKAVHASKARP